MLHLHPSNRYETLLARLLANLADQPGGVFDTDAVVVPSMAVRRSITLAVAEHRGISAGIGFDYLAPWLWRQVAALVPGMATPSPLEPQVLAWRIYRCLEDTAWVNGHARLAHYLADADPVMRWELAERVAQAFDQAATYRPEWLDLWALGQRLPASTWRGAAATAGATATADEAWQASLWQRLQADPSVARAGTAAALLRALRQVPAGSVAGLPPTAHLFALPTVAPVHLSWLQQVALHIDVHVYLLNPCEAYWFEVVDPKRLAYLTARGRAQGHEAGNRLLAAWGKQTQAAIDLLMQSCGEAVVEDAEFTPHQDNTLLAQLHNAVLELRELEPGSLALDAADRSVEVHVCHSFTRELEVLHDRVLGLLADGSIDHPGQVLVLTPGLEEAAPLIDAVFGTAPADRFLPYTVTGRPRSDANPLARVALQLLALAASRWPVTEVLAVLQQPTVARRFGFDAAGLVAVQAWLLQAGVHWGQDASHRSAIGVPAGAEGTWALGLESLFLGHALADPADVDRDMDMDTRVPVDGALQHPPTQRFASVWPAGQAEGGDALALGSLWRFVQALGSLRDLVCSPHSAQEWPGHLEALCATFLDTTRDQIDELNELRGAIAGLADTWQRAGLAEGRSDPAQLAGPAGRADEDPDQTAALPASVVVAALKQALDDPARGGVPSGGITFSSISSLRNLPYRVVAILGLNDGRFPGTVRPSEFDLLALAPRRGDRQRRTDERNLFLDAVLAARSHLHLSYQGRSVRDNAPVPSSVLVAELLDVLVPAIASAPLRAESLAAARRRLVVEHPMQAFSWDAFRQASDPRIRSHAQDLAAALRQSLGVPPLMPIAGPHPATLLPQPAGKTPDDTGPRPAAAQAFDTTDAASGSSASDDDEDAEEAFEEPETAFFAEPLPWPADRPKSLSVEQLASFLANPCRALLRDRLGLHLAWHEDALADDEPLSSSDTQALALADRWLPRLLHAADAVDLPSAGEWAAGITAQSQHADTLGVDWPAGALGLAALQQETAALQRFARPLRERLHAAPRLPPVTYTASIDVDGQAWQLQISFSDLRRCGLVRWRYRPLRASDRLQAWVAHLALQLLPPTAGEAAALPPDARVTRWHAIDCQLVLAPVADAEACLADLIRLYQHGLSTPLHFFPRSAWALVGEDRGSLAKARATWRREGGPGRGASGRPVGESANEAYRLALRGVDDPLDHVFETLASRVYGPLMRAAADGKDGEASA